MKKIKLYNNTEYREWKDRVLNSKSPSFCGAKWYNASVWLQQGWTTSCHHNPPHAIDIEEIKKNPRALHNTSVKKNERAMMQRGEKPANCQFCWVMEETDPNNLADRYWLSTIASEEQLQSAFDAPADQDVDLLYLEIAFDRTCQLACSYCCPSISSSWATDVRNNGAYEGLETDRRQHYVSPCDDSMTSGPNEVNQYAEAFFQWWEDSLAASLKQLRITGGEPMMSPHMWRLLDWLEKNPSKATCRIEITTNLAYDDKVVDKMLDKISRIDLPVWTYVSSESVGAQGEYVRDGLDWQQWERNLDRLIASKDIGDISIIGTINAPNADGFVDFLKWLVEKKKTAKPQGKNLMFTINPVRFPTFQNIVVLPEDVRETIANEIDEFMASTDVLDVIDHLERDHIQRISKYIRNVVDPHKEDVTKHDLTPYELQQGQNDIKLLQQDFKRFFEQYDRRRNKNFAVTFPRLAEWYNNL